VDADCFYQDVAKITALEDVDSIQQFFEGFLVPTNES
jgi:hypothetical protein